MLPRSMPVQQMTNVSMRARNGSPRLLLAANGRRNGMRSSLATACSKRGALVKLCRPAPEVDKNAPTKIIQRFG